ncbi:MAG: NUDIX hydrolase [Caulobacteraceae bacterium]|nr:NUDIX hydrolase [Caulobacteraceae bacterium]
MKPTKTVGIQYGALPFRIEGRRVMVLLMTSRGTKRWVIPKGWPIHGAKPQDSAAIEAAEEAGLIGEVEDRSIGSYQYAKRLKGERTLIVQVIVFPFRVYAQADAWKEQDQRRYRWVRYQKAVSMVAEAGLKRLLRELGTARSPSLVAGALRTYRSWRLAQSPHALG